ncbi:uncharacterized protein LOC130648285 [Hydractinia symbiolongicarpus]|uniref:uncharacterized protein LOC130648285 n=1 Tax=Hydractinia symbiolongicarpus TaxID=13093 RepID=UPI00254CE1B9|nr:uncharacterized protein LOC130648285 [Hydractinia symbiolongicarpus]
MTSVFQGTIVDELLDTMFAQMKTNIENAALPKSGFSIGRIIHLDVDFHKLKLTRGSSYIEAPKWIATKKATINPQNNDEECFKWSIVAALHHEEIKYNPERISKLRPYAELYNWGNIEFQHPSRTSTNLSGTIPILQSAFNEREKQANLLLITDEKRNHYLAIKNLSRLLGREISKNHGKMHFCMSCLQGFQTVESRDKHCAYCKDNEAVKITMPSEKEKWLYYQDGQQQFKVPFVIYPYFESLLIPMKENARDTKTKTKTLNKHVSEPLYKCRGEGCVELFVQHLEEEVKRLYSLFPQKPMLPLTEEQRNEYDDADTCHICMKPFNDENRKIIVITQGCFDEQPTIPAILSYDAHFFIRELGKKYDTQDIGCIAENTEKYISFNAKIKVPIAGMGYGDGEFYKKIEIRFINSCRFMASSLEKLASNLVGTNAAGMKCQQCVDTCLEFQSINAEYVASFWCKACDSNTTKKLDIEQVKANVPAMTRFIDGDDFSD